MRDGQKITFHGEGDQEPGLEPGDVIIVLDQKDHPVFQRQDDNLIMKMSIKLVEALCGFKKTIQTLDNRTLIITSHPGNWLKSSGLQCQLVWLVWLWIFGIHVSLTCVFFLFVFFFINRRSNQAQWHKMCTKWGHASLQGSLWKGSAFYSVPGKTLNTTFQHFNTTLDLFCHFLLL